MSHSRWYDFQGHTRSGSRWGDDLSPLSELFLQCDTASAVCAVILCLCVCHTPVLWRMAKPRMTKTVPHDSSGTLVFWCQRSWQHSNGVTPSGDAKGRWGRISNFWQITRYNLKSWMVQDRCAVTISWMGSRVHSWVHSFKCWQWLLSHR